MTLRPHDVVRSVADGTYHEVLEVRPSQVIVYDACGQWFHPSKVRRVGPAVRRLPDGSKRYAVCDGTSLRWVSIPARE